MKNPTLDRVMHITNVLRHHPATANAQASDMLALSCIDATVAVALEMREANRLAEAAAFRQTQANLIAYATLLHAAGEPVPDDLMDLVRSTFLDSDRPRTKNAT